MYLMNEIVFRDAVSGIVFQRKFAIKRANKKTFIFFEIYWYKTTLSQEKYIESLAVKYNLKNARFYDTSMEANLKLEQVKKTDETIKYRNLIGELLCISTGTRPGITYSVN